MSATSGWAVEVVVQYVAELRPCFGSPRHPALFLTERGTRIALAYIMQLSGKSEVDDACRWKSRALREPFCLACDVLRVGGERQSKTAIHGNRP